MSQKEREELRQLWPELVAEFRASGLGQAQWCRRNGHKVRHLHYWLRKFPVTDASASASPWMTVDTRLSVDSAITVRVGAAEIHVTPGFDPDLLPPVGPGKSGG